jgi:nitroreductase
MNFLELAKNRYSSRDYLNKPVDDNTLFSVTEAARIAPSAANKQPWHFIAVRQKEGLEKLHSAYKGAWLKTAPLILICCADTESAWVRKSDGKNHADIDLAIAVDHITLQATYEGLATCWICAFDAQKVQKDFNLPEAVEPVALLPLGYPSDNCDTERHGSQRNKIGEILRFEKW